jgi:hypothetical protein
MPDNGTGRESLQQLAALAERLPAEARQALEAEVPLAKDARYNQGLLAGLRFALQAARSTNAAGAGVAERVTEAAALTASRILQREADEARAYIAEYKRQLTPERMREIEEELERARKEPPISLAQVIQEMEEIQRQARSGKP